MENTKFKKIMKIRGMAFKEIIFLDFQTKKVGHCKRCDHMIEALMRLFCTRNLNRHGQQNTELYHYKTTRYIEIDQVLVFSRVIEPLFMKKNTINEVSP